MNQKKSSVTGPVDGLQRLEVELGILDQLRAELMKSQARVAELEAGLREMRSLLPSHGPAWHFAIKQANRSADVLISRLLGERTPR